MITAVVMVEARASQCIYLRGNYLRTKSFNVVLIKLEDRNVTKITGLVVDFLKKI